MKKILKAVLKSIPLLNSFLKLFKTEDKNFDVDKLTPEQLKEKLKQLLGESQGLLTKFMMLLVEGISVYGVIFLAKYLGISYEEIISLFGIIK